MLNNEPQIRVGILPAKHITFTLEGNYTLGGVTVSGRHSVEQRDERIVFDGKEYETLLFEAADDKATFELEDVVIGVNFHWERKENQRFKGNLLFLIENGVMTAVDVLSVEDYLASVISSEMSATAHEEFLKAHAVISRSWLLAQIVKANRISDSGNEFNAFTETEDERIRWYDREDHVNYHVCADDHCQRYQGITRQTTERVQRVIDATRGLVLVDNDGELCDARFSKCCGGVFEEFETCWEPKHFHYLEARRDDVDEMDFPDLRNEEAAREWILNRPAAYCNTEDKEILGQVLNNYDQETTDFYRWHVHYGAEELSELAKRRSGIDFGRIIALEPVERGTSARMSKLRIVGTKRTMVIGKELEIRRTLSESHLYSSAFVIEAGEPDQSGYPASFTLHGAGWGHGVGLCQIGAAVMGAHGANFEQILAHYFPGSKLTNHYL